MVARLIPLQLDLPLLAIYDINDPQERAETTDREETLRLAAQEDLQELVTALFALPNTASGVCQLPKHKTVLAMPRSHPLPSARQATRWEQFAKIKGIDKRRKRSAMVYDDELGRYAARHGARSAKHLKKQQDDWCVEVD
jgi:regulator of ribosome biosynthesis